MSRTVVMDFREVPVRDMDIVALRDMLQEKLEFIWADYDKAGDPEDAEYYGAQIDTIHEVLVSITSHSRCPIVKEVRGTVSPAGHFKVYGYCDHEAVVSEKEDSLV